MWGGLVLCVGIWSLGLRVLCVVRYAVPRRLCVVEACFRVCFGMLCLFIPIILFFHPSTPWLILRLPHICSFPNPLPLTVRNPCRGVDAGGRGDT